MPYPELYVSGLTQTTTTLKATSASWGAGLTHYSVFRLTGSGGSYIGSTQIDVSSSSGSAYYSGLSPGTYYYFKAYGYFNNGYETWGQWGDEITVHTVSSHIYPTQPTIQYGTATATSATEGSLEVLVVHGVNASQTDVDLYPAGSNSRLQRKIVPVGTASTTFTGLTPGSSYRAEAFSVSSSGDASSTHILGNIQIPYYSVVPNRPTLYQNPGDVGSTTAYVRWYWGSNASITHLELYSDNNNDGTYETYVNAWAISTGTNYKYITGLTSGRKYRVTGYSESSTGALSEDNSYLEFQTNITLGAPDLYIGDITDTTAYIHWYWGTNAAKTHITLYADTDDNGTYETNVASWTITNTSTTYVYKTGLTPGMQYRAYAWSESSGGSLSSTVDAPFQCTVTPGYPSLSYTDASGTYIEVTVDSLGSDASYATVDLYLMEGGVTKIASQTADSVPSVLYFTGLSYGTAYRAEAYGVSSSEATGPTEILGIKYTVCGYPVTSHTQVTETTARIGWTIPKSATSVDVWIYKTGQSGPIQSFTYTDTTIARDIQNLISGAQYYIVARATNISGTMGTTAPDYFTTLSPPTPPTITSITDATDIDATINFTWGVGTTTYLRLVDDVAMTNYTWSTSNTNTTSVSASTIKGGSLVPGRQYYVYGWTVSTSGYESTRSDNAYFTTLSLPDPPILSMAPGYPTETEAMISFTWGARAAKTSLDLFQLYEDGTIVPGSGVSWNTTDTGVTSHTFTGLAAGTRYVVYGNSYSSTNQIGADNDVLQFRTQQLPLIPTDIYASNIKSSSARINFTKGANAVSTDITVNGVTVNTAGTYADFTGLLAYTTYTATLTSISISNSTASTTYSFMTRPSDFSGFAMVKDQAMTVPNGTSYCIVTSAGTWNEFTQRINQFLIFKGLPTCTFTTVYPYNSGYVPYEFTGSLVQEAIDAMSDLGLTVSYDGTVKASLFVDELQGKLNTL